jgi:hypothetical protein
MQEPILWANKAVRQIPAKRFNEATGDMEDVFNEETGRRVMEKIPQGCHVGGDYDNPVASNRRTWLHVLRHDGHVVRMKLTNAAADLDTDASFPRERRAKARYFGWLLVGSCPLAAVLAGDLQKGQIIAKEIRDLPTNQACAHGSYGEFKPCQHYRAEEKARKALQAKESTRIEKANRSEADKLISAQQEQTKEIVSGVTGALAAAISTVVSKDKK